MRLLTWARSHKATLSSTARSARSRSSICSSNGFISRCGITAAASTGTSNHETGRTRSVERERRDLGDGAQAWNHDGAATTHTSITRPVRPAARTRAFSGCGTQPSRIRSASTANTGQAEARLVQDPRPASRSSRPAPRGGTPPPSYAEVRSIDGPDRAKPATRATFAITIANIGIPSGLGRTLLHDRLHGDLRLTERVRPLRGLGERAVRDDV